jgi:hypothetical protein
METKRQKVNKLPIYDNSCNFEGYDSQKLMLQTTKFKFDNKKRDI